MADGSQNNEPNRQDTGLEFSSPTTDPLKRNKKLKREHRVIVQDNLADLKPDRDKKNRNELETKEKVNPKKAKRRKSYLWALQIFALTFVLSLSFSVLSELLLADAAPMFAILLLVVLIVINILFDIIGVAVTSCMIEPFLAMASKKKPGAKLAVRIVKNAEKVSNICADVVGDICGIISGALGAAIVAKLLMNGVTIDEALISVVFSSCIAAFTVGGKAIGKKLAMDNCQSIVYFVAKLLSVFSKNR